MLLRGLIISSLLSIHSQIDGVVHYLDNNVPFLNHFEFIDINFHWYVSVPFLFAIIYYFGLSNIYLFADMYYSFTGQTVKNKLQNTDDIDWSLYTRAYLMAILNMFTVTLPVFIIHYFYFVKPYPERHTLDDFINSTPFLREDQDLTQSFQFLGEKLLEFTFILFFEEVGFFGVHYLCHIVPPLYKYVHSYHHLFVSPVAVSATACHPLEHISANLFPLFWGPTMLGWNIGWTMIWLAFATFHTLASHSGFIWSWAAAEGHDLHHEFLLCNYGVLFLGDWAFKTRLEDVPQYYAYWKRTKHMRDNEREKFRHNEEMIKTILKKKTQ